MARPPRPSKWHVWRDGRWVSAQVQQGGGGGRNQGPDTFGWGQGPGWGQIAQNMMGQTSPGWTGPGFQPGAPAASTPAAGAAGTPTDTSRTHYMDAFRAFFASLGMSLDAELEAVLKGAIDKGYSDADIDIIMPDIQNTQAFKTRFSGYHQRIANGYNAISLGEYLNLENEYHRIMQSAGLPAGFYDDPSDFGNFIANNVSVQEVGQRVQIATDLAKQVDPTMRNLMSTFYGLGTGDVAAYFLDPNRALPTIEHQYQSAGVASWAQRNGYAIDSMTRFEQLAAEGVTMDQAAQGYSTVRALDDSVGQAASVYGESYGQADAERDVFFNDNEKRRRIMAMEQSTFSGSSKGSTGTAQRSSY